MRKEPTELPPITESEVIRHLEALYKPDIILLGGSRAQGTHQPESDWDLYLIGEFPESERCPQIYKGVDLDVAVYPTASVENRVLRIYFGPVPALRVLRDTADHVGRAIVFETQKAFERGPDRLSPEERERRLHELERLVRRAAPLVDAPASAMAEFALFYHELVPLWFALRGEWSRPLRKALSYIEGNDPDFANLLRDWSMAPDMKTRLEISKSLVGLLAK